MSLRYDYMPLATAPENQPPAAELEEDRHADLERRFWKNVCLQPPLYGADIEGTLFDKDLKVPSPHLLMARRMYVCICASISLRGPFASHHCLVMYC